MMAQVTIKFGEVQVQIESVGVKDVFKTFTEYEVLNQNSCGACQSPNVIPRFRTTKGYDFYSFRCMDCGAELHLGQLKEPSKGLFPKRKNKEGAWLPNRGWVKYDGSSSANTNSAEEEQESPF